MALSKELIRLFEELTGINEFTFCSPWPDNFVSAVGLSMDMDEAREDRNIFEKVNKSNKDLTLFFCSKDSNLLKNFESNHEIAAHGDVHKPFRFGKKRRIKNMLRGFQSSGQKIIGFSPPDLSYWGNYEKLSKHFAYIRIGYMEPNLLFYPLKTDSIYYVPISYYTDHKLKYLKRDDFFNGINYYLRWGISRNHLISFCFHPYIYDAYSDLLKVNIPKVWFATLSDLVRWWSEREKFLFCRNGPFEEHQNKNNEAQQRINTYPLEGHERIELLNASAPKNVRVSNRSVISKEKSMAIDVEILSPENWGIKDKSHEVTIINLIRSKLFTVYAKGGFSELFIILFGNLRIKFKGSKQIKIAIPSLYNNEILIFAKRKIKDVLRLWLIKKMVKLNEIFTW
jgi:hypothetical protein